MVTAVGFEPTPLRNGALSHRLRPLGQTVMFLVAPSFLEPRQAFHPNNKHAMTAADDAFNLVPWCNG